MTNLPSDANPQYCVIVWRNCPVKDICTSTQTKLFEIVSSNSSLWFWSIVESKFQTIYKELRKNSSEQECSDFIKIIKKIVIPLQWISYCRESVKDKVSYNVNEHYIKKFIEILIWYNLFLKSFNRITDIQKRKDAIKTIWKSYRYETISKSIMINILNLLNRAKTN